MVSSRVLLRGVVTFAVLGSIFLMPQHAAGQAAVGTLVGSVHDESGGAVPGATVTATETRANIARTAVSNETGNYTFTNLSPGVYRVDGELVGFRKFSREGVQVDVNTTETICA
jgi:carboxypeptidase family protein